MPNRDTTVVDDIPQWKKDLIARLRNQNKSFGARDRQSAPHHSQRTVQQPNLTGGGIDCASAPAAPVTPDVSRRTDVLVPAASRDVTSKMVQERVWADGQTGRFAVDNACRKGSDSDESEELRYGPGIVKKLKNKYLSLALRETNNRRPALQQLRKAASLEDILDDVQEGKIANGDGAGNVQLRFRSAGRQSDMKRARSVEPVSRLDSPVFDKTSVSNRQSLNEETLIAAQKEGNDYGYRKMQDNVDAVQENKFSQRINRPKRLQPMMSEKEKPPVDVVKQAKMIFERRPEQRTKKPPTTGDVAAKVDSYNNIIVKAKVEAKVSRKPPIKGNKPSVNDKRNGTNRSLVKPKDALKLQLNKSNSDSSLISPIPDVSRISTGESPESPQTNLSETPDLILTTSPISTPYSPTYKSFAENFVKEDSPSDHKLSSPLVSPNRIKPASPLISPSFNSRSPGKFDDADSPGTKKISPTSIERISKETGSLVFKFVDKSIKQDHLPVNRNVSDVKTPPSQPLKIEVNGHNDGKSPAADTRGFELLRRSPPKFTPPPPPVVVDKPLTVTEIEKNTINASKNRAKSENDSVEVVNRNVVPKRVARPREPVSESSFVINFVGTKRDVPDYISNDRSRSASKPDLPKSGEGGIILIPGATILDSFTDEDEEILRSLEGPPSPCDVDFINDNVIIDGKSSLHNKSVRSKLKISFVDSEPDVFEYPSETSLMLDDSPMTSPVQLGHTVPNLSGSSLANYKPKSTEKFQPGVTKVAPQIVVNSLNSSKPEESSGTEAFEQREAEKPFSSGGSADILF
ncbi:unnamed protein product [Phyllotreta striolata]|uniref:Uncharacterized protein n=1 Tax=Phyllotreta striolata TaxID=444603 RepID=A0A9N9XNV3_PHYSR|nr:unnamed protein product [Phyllotreta striolata]